MHIGFFEVEDWEKEYITAKLAGKDISFFTEPLSQTNIEQAKQCEVISPFIYSMINSSLLAQLPNLQGIATRSTGFDHIDIATAKEKGVAVCNVPYYGENTVAEHTMALIMALAKKILQSSQRTRQGDFSLTGLQTVDLKDKTLGIIGMGHIGQQVCRMAKGFDMKVIAVDVAQDAELAKKLGFDYVGLDTLLEKSDIVTLHTALNEKTKHLINSENITKMKKDSYLINTARGGLIETQAIITGLDQGILTGVGLDVLEEECYIKEERQLLSSEFPATCDLKTMLQNHMLLRHENVIITPHNAFNSKEALMRILDTTIENILALEKGEPMHTVS